MLSELQQQYAADAKSGKQVDCVVRVGDAWEELIRLAGNRPDTLIVCGTRDLGSLRRVLFGSTGLKLLRLAPGPVWIVKPPLEENDSVDIVACTDLGPVGADVIRTAVSMASELSARVHVVHAAEEDSDVTELTGKVYEQLAATDYRTLLAGVKVQVSVGDPDEMHSERCPGSERKPCDPWYVIQNRSLRTVARKHCGTPAAGTQVFSPGTQAGRISFNVASGFLDHAADVTATLIHRTTPCSPMTNCVTAFMSASERFRTFCGFTVRACPVRSANVVAPGLAAAGACRS